MKENFIIRALLLNMLTFWLVLHGNEKDSTAIKVQLTQVFENIQTPRPIQVLPIPGVAKELLILLQEGRVLRCSIDGKSASSSTFLDITQLDLIDNAFEEGLLGMVYHPNFQSNRLFYIYHTLQNPKRSVLTERRVVDIKSFSLDTSYQREVISIPQPYWNHNSGIPCFGPDGYLYLSTGDGGKANDPHDHSQNTFSLLGKILRIDVDSKSGDLAYGIPAGNPFFETPGYREEIWALGLRNPWRIHWDFRGGRLFCADVGQHLREEVNLIERGGNYGWNFREGNEPFPGKADRNRTFDHINPVFEYGHDQGTSISGGCVYYGERIPELAGKYIFGDWGTGKSWALQVDSNNKVFAQEISFWVNDSHINPTAAFVNGKPRSPFKPVNFCMGKNEDIIVLDWQGKIYRSI